MQLGLCPEAANHLQEMKDNLIAISNELLDNGENLSSTQIAKLRQDRCAFLLELLLVCDISFSIHTTYNTRKELKGFLIVTFFPFK